MYRLKAELRYAHILIDRYGLWQWLYLNPATNIPSLFPLITCLKYGKQMVLINEAIHKDYKLFLNISAVFIKKVTVR